jgi:hypothetical protein
MTCDIFGGPGTAPSHFPLNAKHVLIIILCATATALLLFLFTVNQAMPDNWRTAATRGCSSNNYGTTFNHRLD